MFDDITRDEMTAGESFPPIGESTGLPVTVTVEESVTHQVAKAATRSIELESILTEITQACREVFSQAMADPWGVTVPHDAFDRLMVACAFATRTPLAEARSLMLKTREQAIAEYEREQEQEQEEVQC